MFDNLNNIYKKYFNISFFNNYKNINIKNNKNVLIFIIISLFIIYFLFSIIGTILKWPFIIIISIILGIKMNEYYLKQQKS